MIKSSERKGESDVVLRSIFPEFPPASLIAARNGRRAVDNIFLIAESARSLYSVGGINFTLACESENVNIMLPLAVLCK